jgi:hypothetical protein
VPRRGPPLEQHHGVHRLALVAIVTACAEQAPSGPEIATGVEIHELPAADPRPVDLLIFVDDTPAMAPYHTRIPQLAQAIADALSSDLDATFDLRIAVTTNDGVLRLPPGSAVPWLETRLDFDLGRTSSFDGALADALAAVMDVPTTNPGPSQPLAAEQQVLSEGSADFARSGAALWIATIAATDDASPLPVADYIAWLQARQPMGVLGIYAPPAPRLDAVQAAFGGRPPMSIDADPPAFPVLPVWIAGGGLCWHATDVDRLTPGPQYDCTFTVTIDGAPRAIPACTRDGEQLCWELVPSSPEIDGCTDADALHPRIHGYVDFVFFPALHVECAL